jgi:two-component system, chemotaxis family, sensor kinase CheA
MTSRDNEFLLQRLLATFSVEADERLKALSALFLELERTGPGERQANLVETLFREVHSLKGAARAVSQGDIEVVCADLESAFAALKRRESVLSPALFEALYGRVDELGVLLASATARGAPPAPPPSTAPEVAKSLPSPTHQSNSPSSETVRISAVKLEALRAQAEELLAFKCTMGDLIDELRSLSAAIADFGKGWDKPASDARLMQHAREKTSGENGSNDLSGHEERGRQAPDSLSDAVLRAERFVRFVGDRLARLRAQAEQEQRSLAGATDQLQEGMLQALLLPFASLLDMLPKLVHDLARDSGKNVELLVEGAALEIDRRILEQIKDPLIHLIRNAVDHGIETPAERARRNKSARGRISVSVNAKEGNKVELAVTDDGAGIDLTKVRDSAIKLGLLAPQDRPDAQEALKLVFESGLSTSPILTDLSGRGLGLAIVREKVERLGGSIDVTQPAAGGTSFRIALPVTLATFRGLVVAAAGCQFVVPLKNVVRSVRVAADDVTTVENRATVEIGGEAVALVRLAQVLNVVAPAPAAPAGKYLSLVLLENAGKRIAFAVDEVLGNQEVLVRGLGPQLKRVPNVAGATVLGACRVVPILSVPDLFRSTLHAPPEAPANQSARAPVPARQSLLVVEDSITSRSLLKTLLESAGYDVTTAVDGLDGLTSARSGKFDLVVSDVEMPRMDGFELTSRLRQDKTLSGLPVVLVTGLESREDKERGIEVGANAYIVKGSFEQSNLLETIRGII